jgi:ankyrin repeat protein
MKIDVTATNLNGSNCLHIGVKLGHMDVVKEVIKLKGFPVDAIKKNGVSAMGIAAYKGSLEMMDILSSKSDLNFTNLQGIGPMYLAIKGNKPDAIRYLIGKKVRIHYDKQEQNDNSPIFYAIR